MKSPFILVCASGGNLTSWGKTYKDGVTVRLSNGETKPWTFIEEESWKPKDSSEYVTIKITEPTDTEGFEVQLRNVDEVTFEVFDKNDKTVGV
jgi:hypothetical protein